MNEFNIDGNEAKEDAGNYIKETFDLPAFNGDYEGICQYLSGFYTKTIINITNSGLIDNEILDTFIRASEGNTFVEVEIKN